VLRDFGGWDVRLVRLVGSQTKINHVGSLMFWEWWKSSQYVITSYYSCVSVQALYRQ